MQSFPDRRRIDLAGEWDYVPLARTQYRTGGVLAEDTAGLPPAATMPVPSNWHREGLADFSGRVCFSRDLPDYDGGDWWLCFGGVDYHAEVAVDGAVLCKHEGAFDPFSVRMPEGGRRLEVTVDAPSEELGSAFPFRKRQLKGIFTQWEPMEPFQSPTGGIWGEVWLERRPAIALVQARLSTFLVPRPVIEEDQYVESGTTDARVLLDATVRADVAGEARLQFEVCGVSASRSLSVPAGESHHRLSLTVQDPELWWPWDCGAPTLHDVRVTLDIGRLPRSLLEPQVGRLPRSLLEPHEDVLVTRIGIREVGFDEVTGTFSVNGEPIPVRGSNILPEKLLSTYDHKRAQADLALARAANLNGLRVCVHISTDALYDAADEAGFLLWQDLPLQWEYEIADALIVEAADQAERIVGRLHNHPSIALWSCHNEPYPANRLNFAGPLIRAVKAADGSRPVHAASDFSEHAYPGWFTGHIRDYQGPPAAPIMTEFGALAFPSADEVRALGATSWPPRGREWDAILHEPSPALDVAGFVIGESLEEFVEASQSYQAKALQRGIEAYRTKGYSYFQFLLIDGWPTVSWSVVSYDRIPKKGYEALTRASQPILIGSDLSRDVLSDAWDSRRFPPIVAVWVCNDTREPLAGATWVARLGGEEVASGAIDVPARGSATVTVRGIGQRWPSWTPPQLEPGEHLLELELRDAQGVLRSANAYPIRFVRRGLDLEPPR